MELNLPDFTGRSYQAVIEAVLTTGQPVAPRGQPTREVLGATLVIQDQTHALPVDLEARQLKPVIGYLEALQLVGGVSHPLLLTRASAKFSEFLDGGTYWGAYGPRLRPQLVGLVERLRENPDSRQEVALIFHPDDARVNVRDVPCTVSLHFLVRDGRLVLHAHMRSNDCLLGLPYDVFQFTTLQCTVARALDLPPGRYLHHVTSLHAYERDVERLEACLREPARGDAPKLDGVGITDLHAGRSFDVLSNRARALLTGSVLAFGDSPTEARMRAALEAVW